MYKTGPLRSLSGQGVVSVMSGITLGATPVEQG